MNLIKTYVDLADEWAIAMENGDSQSANLIHDRIQEMFRLICQNHLELDLFRQVEDASDAASFFIASHIKEQDQPRAINIYKQLLESPHPFISVSSKYILKEM